MRIKWLVLPVMLLLASLAQAQNYTASLTASDTGSCNTANACLSVAIGSSGSATLTLAGTFSGTFQFEGLTGGTWGSISVTPLAGGTAVTSATAAGQWQVNVAAVQGIRIRCSTYASGTATSSIFISSISARTGGSGGGAPSGPAGGDLCSTSTYPNPTVCGVFGMAGPVGPVLNVLSYGASPSLADNATAFAAASVAFNAASLTAGNPAIKSSIGPAGTPAATCTSCTSLNPSFTITPGDVVLIWLIGVPSGRTTTISDSAGNLYANLVAYPAVDNGSSVQLWGTPASGAKAAATSITASISGAAAQLNVIVSSFSNVGSYRFLSVPSTTNAGSTTPSINQPSTLDANNILAAVFGWYQTAQNVSATANSGVIQQSFTSSNTVAGGGLVTFAQATPGSTTDSVTLSTSAGWTGVAIELRSRTLARPILYVPPGVYNYSSGLSFTQPGTLSCTPGTATLNYIGSAHAVDFGATLTANNLNTGPIGDDGCDFTGGWAMTEGLVFNSFNVLGFVRNSTFRNFGTSTSHMIDGKCDNWDLEIGPQNRFFLTDLFPRMVYIDNQLGCDVNSFTRFHDNILACWKGDQVTAGCTAAQSGVGVILDGAQQKFYHNNMAFWSPDVRVVCTTGVTCFGNQIDQNILESAADSGTANVIQFGNTQVGMMVTQNPVNLHGNTSGFIGPAGGSDLLTGARINFNTITSIATTTPLVKLNNLANQTSNYSYSNECSTGTTPMLPCALIHTTGGSINQWNADNWPTCTMASGTCIATFSQTYASAPKCTASWTGTGTLTGVINVAPSTTNVVVTSSVLTDTAVVQINCSAGDSQ